MEEPAKQEPHDTLILPVSTTSSSSPGSHTTTSTSSSAPSISLALSVSTTNSNSNSTPTITSSISPSTTSTTSTTSSTTTPTLIPAPTLVPSTSTALLPTASTQQFEFNLPTIPKPEEDHKLFSWQANGSKKQLKSGIFRQHFRCSNYAEEKGACPARMCVDTMPDGSTLSTTSRTHNHPPPTPGQGRARVHHPKLHAPHPTTTTAATATSTNYTNYIPPHSHTQTLTHTSNTNLPRPSKYHIDTTKHYYDNIVALSQAYPFLIGYVLIPHTSLTIVPPEALALLSSSHAHVIYIDGSLNATKDNVFQMISIFLCIGGIFTPVAWFLTDTRQDDVYSYLFQSILICSESKFDPSVIFCDFDDTLRTACKANFPKAVVFGNGFHFIQAHDKYFKTHRRTNPMEFLTPDLNKLLLSTSQENFQKRMDKFLDKHAHNSPEYKTYIKMMWIERYPPATWAYFGRSGKFSAGDHCFDEWHKRAGQKNWPNSKDRLDLAVQIILEEWDYFSEILHNPNVRLQRLQQT